MILDLDINDVNKILSVLGQAQYIQVAELIDKIRIQVIPQIQQAEAETSVQVTE